MSLHSCAADCSVLQQLYADGYEVATHSLSHQKVRACCGWLAVQVAGREVEHCLLFFWCCTRHSPAKLYFALPLSRGSANERPGLGGSGALPTAHLVAVHVPGCRR